MTRKRSEEVADHQGLDVSFGEVVTFYILSLLKTCQKSEKCQNMGNCLFSLNQYIHTYVISMRIEFDQELVNTAGLLFGHSSGTLESL